MRLKTVEIKGFKSFANDTVLNFNEQVVGVVGPNGSGKSNIVDAIRWVLGEQKGSELRLDKMTDVIFNGTKSRKPAGLASVTITFENNKGVLPTEYSNVSLSRLLYRTGESEYRLNNVPCRLKDIRSLLIDTGIGSNSYAIIALGMVDDILEDKMQARRRMFEQAAGISKYKIRKKETLSKLKSTNADLDRVEDLLFEIKGNMKSLEKQARRTKKYFELKDEYKTMAISHALTSVEAFCIKDKELKALISKMQDDHRKLETEITTNDASLIKARKDLLTKEESLSQSQRTLSEFMNNLRDDEGKKSLLEQEVNYTKQNFTNNKDALDRTSIMVEKFQGELATLENSLKIATDDYSANKMNLSKSESALQSFKSKYELAKGDYDTISLERSKKETLIHNVEKEIAIAKMRISSIENDLSLISTEYKVNSDEQKELEKFITSIFQEIEKLTAKLEKLSLQECERKIAHENLIDQIEKTKDEIVKSDRAIDAKQNEYDLLKSMIENLEGFPESVKYLSKSWKKSAPILSDILDVDEKYRTAIEQFLDSYLNHYIVTDMSQAKQAIQLLREAQKGKANFLLLDRIPNATRSSGRDGLSPAIEVVGCDIKYTKLIEYLLQNVFLTDDEDIAINENEIILASDGGLIRSDFVVTGGSIGLFEGKRIGRVKHLEKIEKMLPSLQSKKLDLEKKLNHALKEESKYKEKSLSSEINQLSQQIAVLAEQKVHKKALHELTLNENLNKQTKVKNYKSEKNDLQEKVEVLTRELKKLGEDHASMMVLEGDGDLDGLTQQLGALNESYNNAQILTIQQENKVSALGKEIGFINNRLSESMHRQDDLKSQISHQEKSVVDNENDLKVLDEKLRVAYEERSMRSEGIREIEQKFYSSRKEINDSEDALREMNRRINQIQVSINRYKEDLNEFKFKINTVNERLKIEFDLTLEDIGEWTLDAETDYVALEEKMTKLRNSLNNYGEINPMAVEAFDEMNERYESITEQKEDIESARKSLLETMEEIESTATQLYMDAFNRIRENFVQVFRSLFTEDDNCDLILMEPDNPLESAIEIIAKPKGKRPISLSQLSGGEKTLTATALLFAIYLLKPAPFCIFDEVDAPLDDANIQKFNNIVKTFSKDSQFVIVTHNKSTMAEVDILYGVYMQEQGVSGVSAVDFRTFDHQPVLESLN